MTRHQIQQTEVAALRKSLPTGWLTTDAEEVARRKVRAFEQGLQVLALDNEYGPFGSFAVGSGQGGTPYQVEIRSIDAPHNTCSCRDHLTNGLGTCKHVEAALFHLRRVRPGQFRRAVGQPSPRTEIYLDVRVPECPVRIAWPAAPPANIVNVLTPLFGSHGALLAEPVFAAHALQQALSSLPPEDRACIRLSAAVIPHLQTVGGVHRRAARRSAFLREVEAGRRQANPLATELYPYQVEGMLHLAFGERALLADDMGLGKTIQAIAAAELLHRLHGIKRVLVVCPVSVKGEWEDQIARFSGRPTQLIAGLRPARLKAYRDPSFFHIVNYEQVRNDVTEINQIMKPDLVILDEAQRIKNWRTLTARKIKQLVSPFAFVLTGTPLENRIDELYSIVEFIDQRLLGPLFRFNRKFHAMSEEGRPDGYCNLGELHAAVRSVMLRRRKGDIEDQLPQRSIRNEMVPMHEEQRIRYKEHEAIVARMGHLARRRPLLAREIERLQRHLACMRMLCDSTYILDPDTRITPKLTNLARIVEGALADGSRKIVIFSEWERMQRLVREHLDNQGIDYAWHTGSVDQVRRRKEISRFKEDPNCRIFLSTDAGATGINLQAASMVVNLDLPWNPARLEQRIARCWRKFQTREVAVVNLVTADSIEERMLDTLRQKQVLADLVLDGCEGPTTMPLHSGRSALLERLDQLIPDSTPAPVPAPAIPQPAPRPRHELFRDTVVSGFPRHVQRIEMRRHADGRPLFLVIVKGHANDLEEEVRSHLLATYPPPHLEPDLEVVDSTTWETLQRLAQSGLVQFEAEEGNLLFERCPAPGEHTTTKSRPSPRKRKRRRLLLPIRSAEHLPKLQSMPRFQPVRRARLGGARLRSCT